MIELAELKVGDALSNVELPPVSRLDLIKYAGASGDYNPIHTIDEEAQKAGLPGIIAHGMWTMGNLSKLFSPFLQDGFIQDYSIRFKSMVFLNDIITLKATLTKICNNKMNFDVSAINQQNQQVIRGNVHFISYE
ncbi:MaoC/PaaZ C-terminal domain-containing protein [Cytobacillus sp. IB215665]|uniref:MaoC/PaaZ C-terminal domain-containing protein n=1 Tax=Cytobacillus sp. IB215665 TaxID=3097357 RepID=UPI002A1587F2|nr:MaoC/PaaZ C-terminal domain-containing protein [Cytobacillus sp. IB215665]MDX8366273.1 MaoC/PaaZ C-terminal domain-containing protein [Cytobacillus sp. IB215665]